MNQRDGHTEKIEKDFSRLLERYNRSKQVIDQLYQSGGKNDTTIRSEKNNKEEKEKEYVSREKYSKMRNLNKELKLTLKEYIDRTKELESAIRGKDDLIEKYEKELREQQENLYNQLQEQKEQILKEDQQSRINEDLRTQLSQAKQKLIKKKAKIQLLKDSQKTVDSKFEDQKQGFQQELERVQKLCEEFSNEIKDSEKRLICLNQKEEDRRYLEMMIQEERDNTNKINEKKILQITIENQGKRVQDLEELLKQAEIRYQMLQGKLDQEKQGLISELQETLQKRKQKAKQMQTQIQQLEQKLQDKSKEDIIVNKQIQDLQGEQTKLQSLLEDQKHKTEQAINEAQFKVQEVKELKGEIEKYRQTLQIQDEKLSKYDVQYQIDQKEKQRLVHEIEICEQESRKLQHLLYEQDREIDYMRQQQEQEILHIEKKVDSLVTEVHVAREEANEWKRNANDLKRQLQQQEEQTNQFKAKYLKSKQNSKNLENEQRFVIQISNDSQLEEKVKLLENEKLLGEREALKNTVVQQKSSSIKQNQGAWTKSKTWIKQHKVIENEFFILKYQFRMSKSHGKNIHISYHYLKPTSDLRNHPK
ncbi:unnamed protein product (macronuclear) [Paramecium tetraurelia]|uniref:Uncharacterized protein n=1 Tax=Paramecium tetraurelia TaxID=5888 RepID=A0DM21_PARTE|nr:uncharacterized protein GSPATT00018306001 [Paramecium tetraurelia]CAK84088.1 unnamed protein product [Paramecium tetraurelia]|eukprot:XP_001451485.1 hypothetical protein (macronuclear) [Paramecium tetraurelia strain d4-2]